MKKKRIFQHKGMTGAPFSFKKKNKEQLALKKNG